MPPATVPMPTASSPQYGAPGWTTTSRWPNWAGVGVNVELGSQTHLVCAKRDFWPLALHRSYTAALAAFSVMSSPGTCCRVGALLDVDPRGTETGKLLMTRVTIVI